MHSILAIAFLIAGQATVDVQVTTVDERLVTGSIDGWNGEAISLVGPDHNQQSVPLAEVLRIDIRRDSTGSQTLPAGEVTLVDGTRMGLRGFTADGRNCQLSVAIEGTTELGAPLSAVRAVRLMTLPEAIPQIAGEWRDLLAMDTTSDLIVIRKPAAENLNFVEGTLGEVTPKSVQFTLDGQTLEVNREKVFGLAYFRSTEQENQKSAIATVSGPGFRIPASGVRFADDALLVTTPYLGVVELPVSAVRSVDYSVNRVQYLSDLEPIRFDRTAPPAIAATGALFDSIALDRGFYAAHLSVEYPANSLPAEEVGSAGLPRQVKFAKGIAVRSGSRATYRVPKGFPKFRATVGIDPLTRVTGSVDLVIVGDERPLFRHTILGSDAPVEVECELRDVREMTVVVDFGPTGGHAADTGDNLHLGGARFTK